MSGIQVSLSDLQICWRLRWWLDWEDDSLTFGPLPLYWLQHPLSHRCLNEPPLLRYMWNGCRKTTHTDTHTDTPCAQPHPRGLLSFLVTLVYWSPTPKYRRWNNCMSSLSRQTITLIVCFLLLSFIIVLWSSTAPNENRDKYCFYLTPGDVGKFLNNDNSLI